MTITPFIKRHLFKTHSVGGDIWLLSLVGHSTPWYFECPRQSVGHTPVTILSTWTQVSQSSHLIQSRYITYTSLMGCNQIRPHWFYVFYTKRWLSWLPHSLAVSVSCSPVRWQTDGSPHLGRQNLGNRSRVHSVYVKYNAVQGKSHSRRPDSWSLNFRETNRRMPNPSLTCNHQRQKSESN